MHLMLTEEDVRDLEAALERYHRDLHQELVRTEFSREVRDAIRDAVIRIEGLQARVRDLDVSASRARPS